MLFRSQLRYTADAPFEVQISFPVEGSSPDEITFNPMHKLVVRDLQPLQNATIAIDLTRSPAWSPGRDEYLRHVLGEPESSFLVHDIQVLPASFSRTLRAAVTQLFTDEPVLISSINFLWGYRIFNLSASLILGILLFIAIGVLLWRKKKGLLPLVLLMFFFFYDARFSIDLLRVSAADLSEWMDQRSYRQLGPLHRVIDSLEEERETFGEGMNVGLCFDGANLLLKQLRYHLYPARVGRIENMSDATHLVLIDTDRGVFTEGKASCGADTSYAAELIDALPRSTYVLRLL